MVRVNLINPANLADQHLVAEYNEILMLLGYVRRYPKAEAIPEDYTLGAGHMRFFKDKLKYLQRRHEALKKEMSSRGFRTDKTINLEEFGEELANDWVPSEKDISLIKDRIIWKLMQKPGYYRYHGEYKPVDFLVELTKSA